MVVIVGADVEEWDVISVELSLVGEAATLWPTIIVTRRQNSIINLYQPLQYSLVSSARIIFDLSS